MSLKVAIFTRTNRYGASENCFLTIDGQGSSWTGGLSWVNFNNYESGEEASRENGQARQPLEARVSGTDFQTEVMRPAFEDANLESKTQAELIAMMQQPRAFLMSGWLWDLAATTPFIDDWSEIDAQGNRVMNLKSLSDLDAVIVEV